MVYFLGALAVLVPFLKVFCGDRCPQCGETCTPMEADSLWGQPCHDCQDTDALLKKLRRM
jgi:hypothetical protein